MSYTARSFDDVQQAYLTALASVGSALTVDVTEGSVAYTYSRAASVVTANQDANLATVDASGSLVGATNTQLDNIGESFGITRSLASYSSGYVLVFSNSSITVAPSTVFTDLATGNQFISTNQLSIAVISAVEVLIPITANQVGVSSNLVAGTLLFCELIPNLQVHVGSSKPDGYSGDLTGGAPIESDIAYRNRIGNFITGASSSSYLSLLNRMLGFAGVERAFVATRVGGFVELWVDALTNYTDGQKTAFLSQISPYVAAGVIPILSQAKRRVVNFQISITPFTSNTSLDSLTSQILYIVQSTIDALSVGDTLYLSTIKNYISPICSRVVIMTPASDITAGLNEVIVIGDLKITYPAQ